MKGKNSKSQYDMEYAKKKLKRIPLDVTKEKYQAIKAAAEYANESVNGYIKKAIDNRMLNENQPGDILEYVSDDSTDNKQSNKTLTRDDLADDNGEPLIMPWEE